MNKIKMFALKLCLLFVVLMRVEVKCDHVPVILWNIKGSSMPLKPPSNFESNNYKSMQDFVNSILEDKSVTMVVYVGDKLSNEDLTPDKEMRSTPLKTLKGLMGDMTPVMFPLIKDPTRHFREVNCGTKDIHAAKHGENLDKIISNAVENSCVVIVHLGSKGLVNSRQPVFKNSKKHIVGVFTASKSSWHPNEELRRKARSLLQSPDPSHFIKLNQCCIMYGDFLNVNFGKNDTISHEFPPTDIAGTCDNQTTDITLTFNKKEATPEVRMTMMFKKSNGSWRMANATIYIEKPNMNKDTYLIIPVVDVPSSFSYSCSELRMKINGTSAVAVLDRFQVQPFDVKGDFFSRSFDCVPFFTLPIWMGIFVAILFIAILNVGVYVLFNIKTMDRFDDPKGKTITVPLGND